MEKVIYALWAAPDEARPAFNRRMREAAAAELLALPNVHGLRLNLQDEHVARAEALRMRCPGADQPDAVAQIWIDVAHDAFRATIDATMIAHARMIAAWSVLSSTIIRNRAHAPRPGERTRGWAQLCFLKRPAELDASTWRHNWQALHTQVAIETQSTFEYVQNLVVRPLIPGPHDYAAIVEECFPAEAMDDAHAFFDAVGDEAKFVANTRAMAESCARFIGVDCVDLLPTSQYSFGWPG